MTPAKVHASFSFAILICALIIVTAVTGAFGRSGSLALLLGGVLGIAVVSVWRARSSAHPEEAQAQRFL
jgi:hypothetical protein